MKNKIKILFCFMVVILLASPSLAYSNSYSDPGEIKSVITKYYKTSYDIYLRMEMQPMDSILDMNSIQNQNFMSAMEENTIRWKYSLEKGYTNIIRERYPIYFEFKNIAINGSRATATVDISGQLTEALEAYPPFVVFGENKFKFNLVGDHWLIADHDYEGFLFEYSKTEVIKFSKEDLIKQIDEEYKGFKETNQLTPNEETPGDDTYWANSSTKTVMLGYSKVSHLIISIM